MPKPLAQVMAIVNRTPDSFYDKGATFAADKALLRIDDAVAAGATIIDIGGVKAGPGDEVTVAEETERVVPLIAAARSHSSPIAKRTPDRPEHKASAVIALGTTARSGMPRTCR